MPHKHRRNKKDDGTAFELPPTTIAKPLAPVSRSGKELNPTKSRTKPKSKSNGKAADNDTPKAFLRLMNLKTTGRLPNGLDDGHREKSKKRKREDENAKTLAPAEEIPTIRPGEKLWEFSARVDQALPIAGLSKRRTRVVDAELGIETPRTKLERRMQRQVHQFKLEETKRKEKMEEAEDEAAMNNMDFEDKTVEGTQAKRKRKKGGRKTNALEDNDDDDDPWEQLKAKRDERHGLHDVVQAPPQFTAKPKSRLKTTAGATVEVGDVPRTAGSLRRREELRDERNNIVEGYRKLMGGKR
jgi:hypothetical protein